MMLLCFNDTIRSLHAYYVHAYCYNITRYNFIVYYYMSLYDVKMDKSCVVNIYNMATRRNDF